jgi:hypothetical protein
VYFAVLVCVVAVFALGSARARASTDPVGGSNEPKPPAQQTVTAYETPTPVPVVTSVPDVEANFAGWERLALLDLAGVLGWPQEVGIDPLGRLSAQSTPSQGISQVAHIRAFDFAAGAQGAFEAEQEDSRLAGYDIAPLSFFGYTAYAAERLDAQGRPLERRVRWLAATWILGFDMRGSPLPPGADQPRPLAEEFLSLAVYRGLPGPPSGQAPTPNPTWVLAPRPQPTARGCASVFADVPPSHWAYAFVYRLACERVVSGYDDQTFRPDRPTTRAQLAKMLVLANGWTLVNPQLPSYSDVPPTNPFFTYVETATARRIVAGYDSGLFRPTRPVTRAQVAKMLALSQGWKAVQSGGATLCDVPRSHWAWPYVQAAVQHGVFTGYGDNCFRPDLPATRAQLSKVLVLTLR